MNPIAIPVLRLMCIILGIADHAALLQDIDKSRKLIEVHFKRKYQRYGSVDEKFIAEQISTIMGKCHNTVFFTYTQMNFEKRLDKIENIKVVSRMAKINPFLGMSKGRDRPSFYYFYIIDVE